MLVLERVVTETMPGVHTWALVLEVWRSDMAP